MKPRPDFSTRYPGWAAFAQALAGRALNIVLVARHKEILEKLAAKIKAEFGVEARVLAERIGAFDLCRLLPRRASIATMGTIV